MTRPLVLLVQLPIPPPGPQPVQANVPLAAGYLKLWARKRGLDGAACEIEIFQPPLANTLGDQGLVEEILARRPWLVGLTCYVWNVERTVWIASRLKEARPDLWIVLGGPEVAPDSAWLLEHPAVDYAVVGEGEQTFAGLLEALLTEAQPSRSGTPCLTTPGRKPSGTECLTYLIPPSPTPRVALDEVSSPYLEGILDAADEKVMFLETMRGCRFRCKFCYYPRGYDRVELLSPEKIAANLRHAAKRGAREVVLLDPTLNQRPDFQGLLHLLAQNNPDRQFSFFGELRAEGIDAKTAGLLRAANFSEVEIGLQSLDPLAQELMGRKINLKAFEGGVRAMLDAGIEVRVDLILGLPGDTPESVRRGIDYLRGSGLYTAVQVFNLSILPGTAFRREAAVLGLKHQPRPPYYVLQTPTLSLSDMYALMDEAQAAFGLEYDPLPPPRLDFPEGAEGTVPICRNGPQGASHKWGPSPSCVARIDLDASPAGLPPAANRAQAFALWLRSADFDSRRQVAAGLIRQVLTDNPHTTLQVILEPSVPPGRLSMATLEAFLEACHPSASYLDLFYSLHPNRLLGAKRLVVVLPGEDRSRLGPEWIDRAGQYATLVWRGGPASDDDLAPWEHVVR